VGSAVGAAKATARRVGRARQRPVNLLQASPVAVGVDTLHLHCDYPVRPDAEPELERLKEEAVRARDAGGGEVKTTIGGLALTVAPHGTGKGPYLLTSEEISIIVNPNAPKGLPTVLLELRAAFLWAKGADAATAAAEDVVRELTLSPGDVHLEVSRLDLAVDFVGWAPRPELLERFTCRAQRRAALFEQWRKAKSRGKTVKAFRRAVGEGKAGQVLDQLLEADALSTGMHFGGKTFTGFSFGAGAVVSRLYLKTREIQKTGKQWMIAIWKRGGYRGGPVWRLEFQLRREFLKEACAAATIEHEGETGAFVRVGKRALLELATGKVVRPETIFTRWSRARSHLNALWRYLMTQWLSYRRPRTKKSRAEHARPWVVLARAGRFEGEQASPEVWRAKLENDHLRTLGQQAGYMARGLAERFALAHESAPEAFDPDAEVNAWVQEVRAYARGHSGDVMERALERWDGINWRRRLYGAASETRH
jgi:hypothetical protein